MQLRGVVGHVEQRALDLVDALALERLQRARLAQEERVRRRELAQVAVQRAVAGLGQRRLHAEDAAEGVAHRQRAVARKAALELHQHQRLALGVVAAHVHGGAQPAALVEHHALRVDGLELVVRHGVKHDARQAQHLGLAARGGARLAEARDLGIHGLAAAQPAVLAAKGAAARGAFGAALHGQLAPAEDELAQALGDAAELGAARLARGRGRSVARVRARADELAGAGLEEERLQPPGRRHGARGRARAAGLRTVLARRVVRGAHGRAQARGGGS